MANTWTDYGVERMLKISLHTAESKPTAAKVILLNTMTGADADATTASGVTEIAAGNGYSTGGLSVALNSTDLAHSDDAANNRQDITMIDKAWTASGGSISAVGAALIVTEGGSDFVWAVLDFGGTVTVTDGGTLTLTGCEFRVAVA